MIDQELEALAADTIAAPDFAPRRTPDEVVQLGARRARRGTGRRVVLGAVTVILVVAAVATVLQALDEPGTENLDIATPGPLAPTTELVPRLGTATATVLHEEPSLPNTIDLWIWIEYSDEGIESYHAAHPDRPPLEDDWEALYQEVTVLRSSTSPRDGLYESEVVLDVPEEAAELIGNVPAGHLAASAGDGAAVPCGLPCYFRPTFTPPLAAASTGIDETSSPGEATALTVTVLHEDSSLPDTIDIWMWEDTYTAADRENHAEQHPGEWLEPHWSLLYQELEVVGFEPVESSFDEAHASEVTLRVPEAASALIRAAAAQSELAATPGDGTPVAYPPGPAAPDFQPMLPSQDPAELTPYVPDSVLENELDLGELLAAMADDPRTVAPTSADPADESWRDAVLTAHELDAGATYANTYVVHGDLSTIGDPTPQEIWLVVLRGLEIHSSGPYGPDLEPRVNHEYIVFVDAGTGDLLGATTFR